MTRNVAVIVGSLRKDSWNRKIAHALMERAPAGLTCAIVEIRDLPLFDQDHEADPGPAGVGFRTAIRGCDAVLFVTPEYNRGVPGVLKNAIDLASRPWGQSVWTGKPGAVVSASIGGIAGFGANHHLRQTLMFLDMPVLAQPEAYIGNVASLFDGDGKLANEGTAKFLENFMQSFAAWVGRFAKG